MMREKMRFVAPPHLAPRSARAPSRPAHPARTASPRGYGLGEVFGDDFGAARPAPARAAAPAGVTLFFGFLPGCAACEAVTPVIQQLAARWRGRVRLVSVNILTSRPEEWPTGATPTAAPSFAVMNNATRIGKTFHLPGPPVAALMSGGASQPAARAIEQAILQRVNEVGAGA